MMQDQSYLQGLKSNIWKYAIYFLTERRLWGAYLGVYFLSFPNHSVAQIGYYLIAGEIAGFILEIPSGYISDKLGHKRTLILSKVAFVFSTLLYIHGGTFPFFVGGAISHAIALALSSGTASAFMHNTLLELKRDNEYAKIIGRIKGTTYVITAVLLFSVPWLVTINLVLPFYAALVMDIIGITVAYTLVRPRQTKQAIQEISATNFNDVWQEAKRKQVVPVIMLAALVVGMVYGPSSFHDVYGQSLSIPLVLIGLFFAGSRVIAGICSYTLHHLKRWFSFRQYMLIAIIFWGIGFLLVGYIGNAWAAMTVLTILVGSIFGQNPLLEQYMLERIATSNFKATILSLQSWLVLAITAGTVLLYSQFADMYGFANAFQFIAGVYIVILSSVYMLLYKKLA